MKPSNDHQLIFEEIEKFRKGLSTLATTEIVSEIFAIVVILPGAYLFRNETILLPIGFLLTVLAAVYQLLYIVKNRIRKGTIPSKEDKLPYLKYWLERYENTWKLARNFLWWGFLPFAPGFILVVIGLYQIVPDNVMRIMPFMLTVGAGSYWWYRYYLGKKYLAGIDKINHLISELESKE